jgi:Zn-finger nucleic acid-binding protein
MVLLQCPKCQASMSVVPWRDHHIERCSACEGLWIADPEYRTLVEDVWNKLLARDYLDTGSAGVGRQFNRRTGTRCPSCSKPMEHRADPKQPHVWLDVCPDHCGVFLDAGEFRDLVTEDALDPIRTLLAPRTPPA